MPNATGGDDRETLAYRALGPEQVLAAVESCGYECDGRLMALNSFENRVYHVGTQDGHGLVAKFYRPHRWPDQAILEEHDFAFELAEAEVPVVAPLRDDRGHSLHKRGPYRFALFARRGGRAFEPDNPDHLEQIGRFIARLHQVGATRRFQHRPNLTIEAFGADSYRFLLDQGFIPRDLELAYRTLCEDVLDGVRRCFERAGTVAYIRVHGDCHAGNILCTDEGLHIVDLDDSRNAPAVQDLWMFLGGDRHERTAALAKVLEGYVQFRSFDAIELHLVEALRTLRLMHYHAWIARRWRDPAFPRVFSWFNTQKCWENHILHLREQVAEMAEQPLTWL